MPPRNLTILSLTAVLSSACYLKADRSRYAAVIADAMHTVRAFYVEDVESRELFENAMTGLVDGLDRYSSYISPDRYRRVEEDLDQEFGGVGIEIDKPDAETTLMVLSPLFDAPAYRQGLRAGDEILQIDGEPTAGMSPEDAIESMRGRPGSTVHLQVLHADEDEPFHVSIVREVIQIQSVLGDTRHPDGSWDFRYHDDPRICYLRIKGFGKHTVVEMKRILERSPRSFHAILIDLRGNAGGLLSASVDICDMFIDEGLIVNTKGRDNRHLDAREATKKTLVPKELPVVVLVDVLSASASEIVAACLQDHKRAVVVGERTWGKGTVQNIFELEGGRSAIRLTTASYWRPSGQNIHRGRDVGEDGDWGVRPDRGFEIKLTDDERTQVRLHRRQRDVVHGLNHRPDAILRLQKEQQESATEDADDSTNGLGETDTDSDSNPQEPTNVQSTDDPQLQRAIDYLQQQLNQSESRATAA